MINICYATLNTLGAHSLAKGMEQPTCPICTLRFTNPVTLSDCTHRFCRHCILTWSSLNTACPLCRRQFVWLLDSKHRKTDITPIVDPNDESVYTLPGHSAPDLPAGIRPRTPDHDFQPQKSSSSSSESEAANSSEISDSPELSSSLSSSSDSANRSPKVTRRDVPQLRPRRQAPKPRRVSLRKKK